MGFIRTHKITLVILFFILLHALLPFVALNVYTLMYQRNFMANWNRESGKFLTKSAASRYLEVINSTETLLMTSTQIASIQTHDITRCAITFANIVKQQPLYTNVFAMSLSGDVYCRANPSKQPINNADRLFFTNTLKTQSFSSGGYTIGKLSKKPVLTFGYPIINNIGNPIGVLAASIDLQALNNIFSSGNLPVGTRSFLLDNTGVILAQYQEEEEEEVIGKNIQDIIHISISDMLAKNDGTITPLSQVPGAEIYFYADIPESYYTAAPNQFFRDSLIATFLVSILVCFILYVDWTILTKKYLIENQSKQA